MDSDMIVNENPSVEEVSTQETEFPTAARVVNEEPVMMEFFSISTRAIQRRQMRKAIEAMVKKYESSMRQIKQYMKSIGIKPTLNNMYKELIENAMEE